MLLSNKLANTCSQLCTRCKSGPSSGHPVSPKFKYSAERKKIMIVLMFYFSPARLFIFFFKHVKGKLPKRDFGKMTGFMLNRPMDMKEILRLREHKFNMLQAARLSLLTLILCSNKAYCETL